MRNTRSKLMNAGNTLRSSAFIASRGVWSPDGSFETIPALDTQQLILLFRHHVIENLLAASRISQTTVDILARLHYDRDASVVTYDPRISQPSSKKSCDTLSSGVFPSVRVRLRPGVQQPWNLVMFFLTGRRLPAGLTPSIDAAAPRRRIKRRGEEPPKFR
jgi:hypothetical protein